MNRRVVPVIAALAAVLATVPGGPTPAAHAAGKPDLVVKTVGLKAHSVAAGGVVRVSDTTKNVGSGKAGASRTAFYLSTDQKRSKGDHRIGTRQVARLGAGAHSTGTTTLTVPATTKARAYWVIACADDGKKVTESKEGNNCRTSTARLTVTAGSPGVFPQTPDPAPPVTATDDAGFATVLSGTYSPVLGLDLTAYDAAGTTSYHLHLPGDFGDQNRGAALQGHVDVTMTVLSSVSGLPSGTSFLAGVRLEPEGLQLANPGTLTITGPGLTSGNLQRQTGAVFNTGGTDLSMSPILPPSEGGSSGPDVAVLSISHFSSPVVLDASAAGRQYLLAHPPARVLEQLQAKAAELFRSERLSELAGGSADPSVLQDVQSLYDDYFDHQVVQELNAALTDDKIASTALDDAFRWERFTLLNGGKPGARGDLLATLLPKIVKNAIDKSWARCAVDHHLSDIIILLGIARWADVLGAPTLGSDAYGKALACGHFQAKVALDVTHSYHYPAHQVGTFSQDVEGHWATQQATLDIGLFDSTVTSPLQYDTGQLAYSDVWKDYEGTSDCPVFVRETDLTSTVNGTVKAYLFVDINPYEVPPGGQQPPVQPGKLVLTFAGAHETYHEHYTQCATGSSDFDFPGLLGYAQSAFQQASTPYSDKSLKIPIDPAGQVGATLYNDVFQRTWDNHQFLHEVDSAAATVTVVHKPDPTP
ncbi:CARDB domain-containing protein [Nocardioides sp. MH1]|uniref:CARDB domain-containing protein n=1 Tax=Nocardioides sp. MH1 TaxID=3242490 RepID=UPI0035224539